MFIEKGKHSKEITGELVKIGIPIALSSYFRSLLLTVEHVLIPKRLLKYTGSKSSALASYGALHGMALPIILYPYALLGSFCTLLVPEICESYAENNPARVRKITEKALIFTIFFSFCTCAVIISFSKRLGMNIYSNSEACSYIRMIAPLIPVMYLDSVTDAVLKGIGEQVYSMWVNISDSFLCIVLVIFLLPAFGAKGYALVIAISELYNFAMSFSRLMAKVKIKINITFAVILPLVLSIIVARASFLLFSDASGSALSLTLGIVLCSVFYSLLSAILYFFVSARRKKIVK